MIVEFPQAESCCGALSLRLGVVIVIVIRLVFFLLLILFWANVLPVRSERDKMEERNKICYDLHHVSTAELVMMVVTVTLLVLWLLVMIPAVILEMLTAIVVGAILEIVIWFWFFLVMAFHLAMSVIGQYVSFMFFYSFFWLVIECYVLWLVWSYYVDVKANLLQTRTSQDTEYSLSTTSTY